MPTAFQLSLSRTKGADTSSMMLQHDAWQTLHVPCQGRGVACEAAAVPAPSQLLAATISVLLLQRVLKQVVLLPLGPAGAIKDRGGQSATMQGSKCEE